jgi:hypothetical protein
MRMIVNVVTVVHSLDNHLYEYVLSWIFSFNAATILYIFFELLRSNDGGNFEYGILGYGTM